MTGTKDKSLSLVRLSLMRRWPWQTLSLGCQPNSQRYLVLGLVGLVGLRLLLLLRLGLVELALWSVSVIVLIKYSCEYGTLSPPQCLPWPWELTGWLMAPAALYSATMVSLLEKMIVPL